MNRPTDADLMTHEQFRQTDGYRELCAEFEIDPAAEWHAESLPSIAAAADFFYEYETMRRSCSAWTPARAAAALEGLLLSGEGNASGLVWTQRFGPVLITTDPVGGCWAFTAQHYDATTGALAMARDQVHRASQS